MNTQFLRIARWFALMMLLSLASTRVVAAEPNDDIYGVWKITSLIGGGIGSLNDRQARKLIGKPVIITAEKFSFNGRVCKNPAYERSTEDTVTYFDREWRTSVNDIPFPEQVTIIETPGCDFLFPIRKDHLMIAEDGGFFEAVRVKKLANAGASKTSMP
jgi:hypothetical protein